MKTIHKSLRYKGPLDTAPTVLSTYGTGGNSQPFVVHSKSYDVRLTSEGTRNARSNVYETEHNLELLILMATLPKFKSRWSCSCLYNK